MEEETNKILIIRPSMYFIIIYIWKENYSNTFYLKRDNNASYKPQKYKQRKAPN